MTFHESGRDIPTGILIASKYRILSKLGAGGMGEVYRAEDSSLNRQVALKVLPDVFAADRERLARFQREAKVLASLNHPNIAAIYGVEEADGKRFLVLELVEGQTLAERLRKGPLPLEETLEVCRQIAEGLENAHEKSIVHRDLKPSNIKITPEGKVKILDFGLARAFLDRSPGGAIIDSPTITAEMTQPGIILGTASYMSPEQAKGKQVDKRADIWAFGCIIFECLTGKMAFPGETITEVLASVLKGEPDWESLPKGLPANVRTVLGRCLQKDRSLRYHDIADAWIDFSEDVAKLQIEESAPKKAVNWQPIAVAAIITFIMTAIVIAVLTWNLKRLPVPPLVFTTIDLPIGVQLPNDGSGPGHTEIALSPDGKILFFSGSPDGTSIKSMLYARPLDKAEATSLPGTEGAREPFISSDGQWIGFWAQGKLKKVASSGKTIPTVICDCPDIPQGVTWSADGRIIIGTQFLGLQLLSGEGGKLKSITTPDPTKEMAHVLPSFLPGGKAIIFCVKEHSWGTQSRIESLVLDSGERKSLIEDAADGRPSPTGHLVFVRTSALMAAPFDAEKVKLIGPAVPVVEGIMQALNATSSENNSGSGQFQFSSSGHLSYASGGIFSDPENRVARVDQEGNIKPVAALDHKPIISVRLSPDERSFVYRSWCKKAEIWVYDFGRGTSRMLTREGRAMHMNWTPDGKRVTCAFSKAGVPNIFWLPSDGSGTIEPLIVSKLNLQAGSWSSDGRYLLYIEHHPSQSDNIWVFDKDEKKSSPLFNADYDESYPEFSPDGRYLAYCTNETGRLEVYVTTFPVPGRKTLVSTEGGVAPVWASNGRKLYYWNSDWTKMIAVEVTTGPTFSAGSPRFLFEFPARASSYFRPYDITLDGTHFLLIGREEVKPVKVTQLILVQNWFEELKRLVPAGKK